MKKRSRAEADPHSPPSNPVPPSILDPPPPFPPIFLPMAGGSSLGARRAFASSLLEPFYGPEVEAMKQIGIKNLDEGVVGYSFDLAPLREQSSAQECLNGSSSKGNVGEVGGSLPIDLIPLIQTSLIPLTPSKPRLVNSTDGPHEMDNHTTTMPIRIYMIAVHCWNILYTFATYLSAGSSGGTAPFSLHQQRIFT